LIEIAPDAVRRCGSLRLADLPGLGVGNLVGPVAAQAAVALALDGTAPPECFAS